MPSDQAVGTYNKTYWGNMWPCDQGGYSNNSFPEIGPHFPVVVDLVVVVVVESEVAFVFVDAVD